MNAYFKVHYLHGRGYGVVRSFETEAAAEEFISANALVYPLPGLRREYPAPVESNDDVYDVGDSVMFDENATTFSHGTVTRGNWSRTGTLVTVKTDDGRTFVRDTRGSIRHSL